MCVSILLNPPHTTSTIQYEIIDKLSIRLLGLQNIFGCYMISPYKGPTLRFLKSYLKTQANGDNINLAFCFFSNHKWNPNSNINYQLSNKFWTNSQVKHIFKFTYSQYISFVKKHLFWSTQSTYILCLLCNLNQTNT